MRTRVANALPRRVVADAAGLAFDDLERFERSRRATAPQHVDTASYRRLLGLLADSITRPVLAAICAISDSTKEPSQ
jgi:hypothetical protein